MQRAKSKEIQRRVTVGSVERQHHPLELNPAHKGAKWKWRTGDMLLFVRGSGGDAPDSTTVPCFFKLVTKINC